MAHEHWNQVKEIFHDALRREPGERDGFLDEACTGNIDLRIEVESLLISLAEAENFLEQPLIGEPGPEFNTWRLTEGQEVSHYKVISPLATGGMGEIYLAEDQKLHRRVALKILPQVIFGSRDQLRRFKREAEVVSALNHPNILTVFEFGTAEDVHFLACELVQGETLRARLDAGRLSPAEALDIGVQIATALQAAHNAGIVHRDIKPENVMIRNDGYVKVLDFGLAKLTERRAGEGWDSSSTFFSQPGVILGTTSYMSPEQARAMVVDERSDLFSFGVVLYEMLAGRVPFSGETMTDVIAAIIQEDYKPMGNFVPNLPPALDDIVRRLLAKERGERYQSAADLLTALKDAAQFSEHEFLNANVEAEESANIPADPTPLKTPKSGLAAKISRIFDRFRR